MNATLVLQILAQILNDNQALTQFSAAPDNVLSKYPLQPEEYKVLLELLLPLQKLRETQQRLMDQQEKTRQEIEKLNSTFRTGITNAIEQTIKGFDSTMKMYKVSFYVGIVLLAAAILFAIITRESLFPIIFGSIGTVTLITFFIAKPPQHLQQSRSQHTKLNAAFYSWFVDIYNWNSFFLQYSQKGREIDFQTMKDVSSAQIENTERLMKLIDERILN